MDITETRRRNLRDMVATYHRIGDFLTDLSSGGLRLSSSAYSVMAGPNPSRPVSESTARKIERALRMPNLILDEPDQRVFLQRIEAKGNKQTSTFANDSDVNGISPTGTAGRNQTAKTTNDATLMCQALQAVMSTVEDFNPGRHGRVVYMLYENAKRTGVIDMDLMEQILDVLESQ